MMCYLAAEAENIKCKTNESRLLAQLEAQQAKDVATGMGMHTLALSMPVISHAVLRTF